jgi:hypothetical protein
MTQLRSKLARSGVLAAFAPRESPTDRLAFTIDLVVASTMLER